MGDPLMDDDFKRALADDRQLLAEFRLDSLEKALKEKDQRAVRKYEEALLEAGKGNAEAEGLYGEAIALWEEVLARATVPDYQRVAVARLASVYHELGELRQQLGKPREAETALRQALDYWEKAVKLGPGHPLYQHNLKVARQTLVRQQEKEFQEEISRLCTAERFADALDLWEQSIEEQEEQLRTSKDREAAVRRLAYRVDRFAWFLAHCPDGRMRDTKAAVKRAQQATRLQPEVEEYWYTLAMVQYRNGNWQDSLESLEQMKTRTGEFQAIDWLLVAMNQHHLKQRGAARTALRKAVEWMAERKRQAEDNEVLRFRYELMQPAIEELRREAEKLLDGKDPANQGVA